MGYVLGFTYVVFYILSVIDIVQNDFINGKKDKILFSILTTFLTPLFYYILSYGHKIQMSQKQKVLYKYLENFSIILLILVIYSFILMAMSQPNTYGIYYLILMGTILLGVIFFHILYPKHWELYEEIKIIKQKNTISWFKIFPWLLNILIIISVNFYIINIFNIFVSDLVLLASILIAYKNSKSAFIFLTLLAGPIFWFLNYFYLNRNKIFINNTKSQYNQNLKSHFLY